jgi:glycosyltransferase involved in cell wall biosynthesis
MEKPVVASNTTSLPEVVSGRYVLVEPGNAKAIAEGVEKVYRCKVEENDKKIFSWDKCVDVYLKVYQEAMYVKQG